MTHIAIRCAPHNARTYSPRAQTTIRLLWLARFSRFSGRHRVGKCDNLVGCAVVALATHSATNISHQPRRAIRVSCPKDVVPPRTYTQHETPRDQWIYQYRIAPSQLQRYFADGDRSFTNNPNTLCPLESAGICLHYIHTIFQSYKNTNTKLRVVLYIKHRRTL